MVIDQLSRKSVQKVSPYEVSPRTETGKEIYLDANENPYPRFYTLSKEFNRYPESQPPELIKRYADYLGVDPHNILVTLGGDESIELLIKAFCEPNKDSLLYAPPTFGMYQITCDVLGIKTIQIPLLEDFSFDVSGVLAALDQVKMIFICSPNNPTGNTMAKADILQVLEATKEKAIVVLDEAYIEFCPEFSVVNLINQYPHLAIVRTLSKAFGLAGIRCGFTVASQSLIDVLKKVVAPYPIPAPVIDIAMQTVNQEGIHYMESIVKKIIDERERLVTALPQIPCVTKVYPSDANWLLVEFNDADRLFNHLLENNIFVRQQSHPRLNNAMRISIGTPEQNDALLTQLTQFK